MNISLKAKILLSFLAVGVLPLSSVGIYSYMKSSESLQNEALTKLESVRNLKSKSIERYFNLIRDQALTMAHNEGVKGALVGLKEGFDTYLVDNKISVIDLVAQKEKLRNYYVNEFAREFTAQNAGKNVDATSLFNSLTQEQYALQAAYIVNNSNPLGSKHLLTKTGVGKYNQIHELHHPNFREYLERFEFYDIFLIDGETGNIIYTVYKELDFSTSLKNGPYKDSGLAKAFQKAMELNETDKAVMSDYEVYRPSYDGPASFIAAPIWINGVKKGVIAFQISFDKINSLTLEKNGNEETLETYLVGNDYKMRSDTMFDKENRNVKASFRNPDKGSMKTESIKAALNGESKNLVTLDYLGKPTLESYAPIEVLGNKWAISSVYRLNEAFAPIYQLRDALIIFIAASALATGIFALWFDRSVVSALIKSIAAVADGLGKEATTIRKVSISSAEMATKLSESTTEQAAGLQETVASIDEISAMVTRNADSALSSVKMSEKSTLIAQGGKEKAELMMESINAISEGNEEIISQMQTSNKEISEIVKVIQDISHKTQVINDIVFQTKLLSFNASVEAARAGEHGKGFAVVAEEVGNLAAMSGRAATEITDMLSKSVQRVTDIVNNTTQLMDNLVSKSKEKIAFGSKTAKECTSALDEILVNVSAVNEMVHEISTASQEQSTGVKEVNKVMSEMDQVTQENSCIAQESSRAAHELRGQSDRLNTLVIELSKLLGQSNKHSVQEDHRESYQSDRNEDNIIKLKASKKEVKSVKSQPRKKIVGSTFDIPESNDGRFEDV